MQRLPFLKVTTMRKTVLFALTILAICSEAKADCLAALKPDQIKIEDNFAFEYQFLKTINQSNYAEHQANGNAGAQYLGISGDVGFSEFDKKRSEFFSHFDEKVQNRISSNYVFNGLSALGYRAYSDCIRQNAPLSAWIEDYNESQVIARVKSYAPSGYKTNLVVSVPSNPKPRPFVGAGEQQLVFNRPKGDDLLVSIQLYYEKGNPYASAVLKLGRPLHLRKVRREEVVHLPGHCGAGCQGHENGCQNTQDIDATPRFGYQFARDPKFTVVPNPPGVPGSIAHLEHKMDIGPDKLKVDFSCVADNPHGQKFVYLDVSITQFRDVIEEELPTQ